MPKRSSKNTAPAERAPQPEPERPPGYRQTIHLGCDATDLKNLDKCVAKLERDPIFGRIKGLGRERAALVAIAHFAEKGPERISVAG